jgi:lysophospholipase L1-like esterase
VQKINTSGINDLIRGVPSEQILENSRLIIRDLLWVHPNAKVVLQSILPHSGPGATWEGRDRLLAIPNQKIRELNRSLKEIAAQEGATYLDLHPLFADDAGNLSLLFTTDGLHLNQQGYLVWRSALILFMQLQINV